jgi:rhodanese-related sulfurtransferase
MIESLKKLFGLGPKTNYSDLIRQGAIVVDVRTVSEFKSGHIKGSQNVTIDSITAGKHPLKDKQKPLILCCRSGMRSAAAMSALQRQGFAQVYNGGGWQALQQKLNQNK